MTLPPHTADALTRLALALARAEDLDAVLWAVAHEAIGTLRLEDCVVYLVDHDRDLCVQRAAYGPKNPQGFDILHPIEIRVGQGIVGTVAATARAVRVDDTRGDPRYIIDDASRASELAVPIVHHGQVIGVLDSEHSRPAFFTPSHEEVFAAIAALASTQIAAARLRQELAEARDRAEAAVRSKRDFLLMMHHELRTPLHGILGVTSLLADRLPDADDRELLDLADRSARSLMTVLEDVLTVADLGQDRVELAQATFDPVVLMSQVSELFAGVARTRRLSLTLLPTTKPPAPMVGDQARVRQVLMHLVSNALKFTGRGSVDLRVEADGTGVRFIVRDTGIGFSPSRVPQLLEAFTQGHSGADRSFEGMGLGLSVAHGLVSRMGGSLEIKSFPGTGTEARIWLPQSPPHARS
jgi:signal transduction histidine kinase